MALMVRIAEEGSTPPIDDKLEDSLKDFLGACARGAASSSQPFFRVVVLVRAASR